MGTITSTSIGANTIQITTSGKGNTFSDFVQKVADAITGTAPLKVTGWTLYDINNTGTGITQVFRSLNLDGITYKNIILRWDKTNREVNVSTCESWNSTTHVATNEAFTYYNCSPVHFDLSNGDLIVMAHPRWCVFQGYVFSEPDLWAGVFEMEREDVSDTASNGYPCWGVVNSTLWTLGAVTAIGANAKPLNATDFPLICLPRSRSGETGINAAKGFAADYGVTSYPNWLAITGNAFSYYLGSQGNKFIASMWDSTKRLVMPVKPIHNFAGQFPVNYGNICGLKTLCPVGNNMSKITVAVDDNGNFTNAGTDKEHWVLNTQWRGANNDPTLIASTVTNTYTIGGGLQPLDIIPASNALYIPTATQMVKFDLATGLSTNLFALTSYSDFAFDGERYIYIVRQDGVNSVYRIDTVDDSYVVINNFSGYTNLPRFAAITSTRLIVSCATAAAIPQSWYVPLNSFNSASTAALVGVADGASGAYTFLLADQNDVVYSILSGGTKVSRLPAGQTTWTLSSVVSNIAIAAGTPVSASMLDQDTMIVATAQQATGCGTIKITGLSANVPAYTGAFSMTSIYTGLAPTVGVNMNGDQQVSLKLHGHYMTVMPTTVAGGSLINSSLGALAVTNPISTASTVAALVPATTKQFLVYDGSRLIAPTNTGIKIYSNLNTQYVGSNITLGQVAIPA